LNKLPPTLRIRETIVFDREKEVPEEIKKYDIRKKNQKKRYETKYNLEKEYRDKDVAG
jgi:cytidylate kinase